MKAKIQTRKNDVDTIMQIIEERKEYKENSQNGLVILLNGTWGSGKTTFIDELVGEINKNDNMELLANYNSYQYDFYDKPYIPLFATIEDKINLKKDFSKFIDILTKQTKNNFVVLSYAITKSIFKSKFKVDLDDIKNNFKELNDEDKNADYKKDFLLFKQCKDRIKKNLSKICEKKVQIFIVDELDRCKPTVAMETLEVMKHFFDIENCVFIIAVDKIQLQESAKTIYGQGMDSEKYFSKFFDYQHNLLPINFYEAIDINDINEIESIIRRSTSIFNLLKVSLRDAKKIFNEFAMKYKNFSGGGKGKWSDDQSIFIIFLLTLKYTDLLFYNEILNGNYLKFKKKVNDEYSSNQNNYTQLLLIRIGENKSFDYVLTRLSSRLNNEYMDIEKARNITTPFMTESDRRLNAIKDETQEMFHYIPQVIPGITYKSTIEKIIE